MEYCHEMGGVDLTDQLLEYYHFLRKSCKWWRKLWVHCFNMIVLNAFLLNKTYGLLKDLSQTDYRYVIAQELLQFTPIDTVPLAASSWMPALDGAGHWPERLPISDTAKTKRRKLRKCAYCFVSARDALRTGHTRKEASTTIICCTCKVALCVYPCFGLYHVRKESHVEMNT